MKSSLVRITLFSFLFLLIAPQLAHAEIRTFIKEYTYHAGDEDSKNSSRTVALREIKRLLLEELGTYLESQTEVKNFQLTKDQITTLTAGIVSAEVIEDAWDGKAYWVKAKIAANPQDMIKSIDSLRKDHGKVTELEQLRKKSEELLQENVRLNRELKKAHDAAKQEAAQAYKLNIDNLGATEWFERGYEFKESGNYADAVKAFSRAIELNPRDAAAYYNRGLSYDKIRGNYPQAINDYGKAIELNPMYGIVHNVRMLFSRVQSNSEQKIIDYNKTIELNPSDADVYNKRGEAYSTLGYYQQAITDYDKAIELNPQFGTAYNNRGEAYDNLGNYQQAILDYNKAVELNPHDADAYRNRGLTYFKLHKRQQANKDYVTAARLGDELSQFILRAYNIKW